VVVAVEGNGDLRPLKVLGVAGETVTTSRAMSFCFLLDSYDSGPLEVVDLLMSLGEVTPGILRLFLLNGPFGRLEKLIYKTL
jgi:hypothetical protein